MPNPNKQVEYCSFCGLADYEVGMMVTNTPHSAYLCVGCADGAVAFFKMMTPPKLSHEDACRMIGWTPPEEIFDEEPTESTE